MSDLQHLLADAAQLPIVARIELVEAIWDSIPEQELPSISDEWREEIKRRSTEFDAGGMETVGWDEVRQAAHERLKRRSS